MADTTLEEAPKGLRAQPKSPSLQTPRAVFRNLQARVARRRLERRLTSLAREVRRETPISRDQGLLLAEKHNRFVSSQPPVSVGPLVSIIMPVWNRASVVGDAISSVVSQDYANWELIVVDDGSTDDLAAAIKGHLEDSRVRLMTREHRGVSQARNVALAESRGDIIAYLDSDNLWFPHYLREVVRGFERFPRRRSVYLGQLVEDREAGTAFIRYEPFDRTKLVANNFIDLNVFAHRRALFEAYGGFDPELTRVVDWDLLLRYTEGSPPARIPVVGGIYNAWSSDRVTNREPYWQNRYKLLRKQQRHISAPLKVLYVLWHYPHLSETYVRWEMECMRRWGVEIEVWSNVSEPSPAPFETDFKVHSGPLSKAIQEMRPDIVHAHWCGIANTHRGDVASAGLPMTVRSHSFPINEPVVGRLDADPTVAAIFMFPDKAAVLNRYRKVRPTPVGFDGAMSRPGGAKDRRMVLRAGAAVPSGKDHEFFLDVARLCPEHRFVMAAVICQGVEDYSEDLKRLNDSLGCPVDLRFNLSAEDVAALTRQAGIYLHTKSPDVHFGMPISIAESMATGCYALARRCPAATDYLGDAGATYSDQAEAARLITETMAWDEAEWARRQQMAVEHAYGRYADIDVFRPMLDTWLTLVGRDPAAAFRD